MFSIFLRSPFGFFLFFFNLLIQILQKYGDGHILLFLKFSKEINGTLDQQKTLSQIFPLRHIVQHKEKICGKSGCVMFYLCGFCACYLDAGHISATVFVCCSPGSRSWMCYNCRSLPRQAMPSLESRLFGNRGRKRTIFTTLAMFGLIWHHSHK